MSTQIYTTLFQFKRGSAKRWLEVNPVLLEGEPGYELDTGKLKIGNGISTWKDLEYLGDSQVFNASTHYDFPSFGKNSVIYKAEAERKIYQWNPTLLIYEVIGDSEDGPDLDIEIINGGNANG